MKLLNNYLLKLILIVTAVFAAGEVASAQHSLQVLRQCASKISGAKGISCGFSVTSGKDNVSGTMKLQGKKFYIDSPASTVWFDGNDLWTLNKASKEIVISKPDAEELTETNPLSYLNGFEGKYKVGFSSRKDNLRHIIVLNPRSKGSNIKAVEVAINKKSLLPERLIVRDNSDRRSYINVKNLNTNAKTKSSDFVCKVENYKDYEVIDMR